jgi:hypothetical protein
MAHAHMKRGAYSPFDAAMGVWVLRGPMRKRRARAICAEEVCALFGYE